MVEVRDAGGLAAAAQLMRRAHHESRYAESTFNGARFYRYHEATTLAEPDRYALVLAYLESRPVGQLSLTCSYLYWADLRVATVGLVYVVPEHRESLAGGRTFRRLLAWAIDWARARRIEEFQVQANAGVRIEAISSALERFGFRSVGGCFALPLV